MYFTGNILKSIPKTQNLKFEFDNIYLSNTGVAEIGFSGSSGTYSYLISGNKVYDSSRKYIYSYFTPFNISGIIQTGANQTIIGGQKLKTKIGQPLSYNYFYVKLNNTNLNSDVYIYNPLISYNVAADSTFVSQTNLGISIQNNSTQDFKIFTSSITYNDDNANTPIFSGIISGEVSGNSSKSFSLQDLSQQINDKTVNFNLTLDTNFGQITNTFATTALSGTNFYNYQLMGLGETPQIPVLFYGPTGLNSFQLSTFQNSGFASVAVSKFNLQDGTYQSGAAIFEFTPYYPADGQTYLPEYVTGIDITSTGVYSVCPTAQFTEYYYVDSVTLDSNTVLSTGCTGKVNFIFTPVSGLGTGASGYLLTRPSPENDTFLYGAPGSPASYYVVTGSVMTSNGSGYNFSPIVSLNTAGAGAGCSDYTLVSPSGSLYPYSTFSGTPALGGNARYLTGLTVCYQTGSIYSVSGIIITNPGSGYSSTFYPKVKFIRDASDVLTNNASGVIQLNKQSKTYSFFNSWDMSSGYNSFILDPLQKNFGTYFVTEDSGYYFLTEDLDFVIATEGFNQSGILNYPNSIQYLYLNIKNTSTDYIGNQTGKLTIINEDNTTGEYYFVASRQYSSDPYFLINASGFLQNSYTIFDFLNQGLT